MILGSISGVAEDLPLILVSVLAAVGCLLLVLQQPGSDVVRPALISVPTATVVSGLVDRGGEGLALGLIRGTAVAVCACLPALVLRAVRQRRAHLERGWATARAETQERDFRVREGVLRERQRMAGEIHDGLGHRITLLAVQASRLSLDETLPTAVRRELAGMRAAAASASDDLGRTVRLLAQPNDAPDPGTVRLEFSHVVDRARESGMTITVRAAADLEQRLGDYSRAAVLRAVQEGLTNAAKHAPDQPVLIETRLTGIDPERPDTGRDGTLTLKISNPVVSRPSRLQPGYGLSALRHRAEILGGSVEITETDQFVLTLVLPADAVLAELDSQKADEAHRIEEISAEQSRSSHSRRRALRLTVTIPVLLAVAAALAACGYVAYKSLASVLPTERFVLIEPGQRQEAAKAIMPWTQMLDAPRSTADAVEGKCHYYESSVSLFDRDDVFRICIADGVVRSVRTVPAP